MQDILVLGAGKIGALISGLLSESGDYRVQLADSSPGVAAHVVSAHKNPNVTAFDLDATDKGALTAHIRKYKPGTIVSGLPYYCNLAVAEVARAEGLNYFDLTEDVAVTEAVRQLADGAEQVFAPQCGLAPGFISIAANELIQHFDELRTVKLRVGALPQHPNNVLKYSLTWSTDGVINEYGNLCQSIVNGKEVNVLPLEGLEQIEIDGTLYEAFNTSGGLGSLGETYGKRARSMNYKTIRYPGHCEQIRLLMNGLNLNHDRPTLKRILENAVPQTLQDVVIIYAAVTGMQDGEFREENYVNKVYPQVVADRLWSAIQITTAAGICSVLDIVLSAPGKYKGFVAQEQFRLADVLNNRFGKYYAHGGTNKESAERVARGQTGHQRSKGAKK
ncbi:MAG: saccharopine dehydrogenase NADP-binding domain-containing protein [Gammaproteobacteria bacterium]|nr:saccharopine dehydrogenase NADP-binding domain-containing protein [Gammaproteobacteria bacterium]MDH5304145.1 saccharopine dehydrogenase NADP-binding domain-containing protein [Gammaproteobacteria bacterium]MDH5321844.1 saccharopine dehydrogenase NADP-binding domain-containing protein [Gammaproteobacteria bacterium]